MSKLPIGIQLYSVRDYVEKDFAKTLIELKSMGCDAVEFAGLFGYSAKQVKEMCDNAGLIPISAHVGKNVIMGNVANVIGDYAEIGCKYIAIPWASAEKELAGSNGYQGFLEDVKVIADECDKYDMKLLYHNHDFEFNKIDEKYILDKLFEDTSKDQLQTQIDACWAMVGGVNPANYILKYSGRAPLVHIKDFVGLKSADMYELIDGGQVKSSTDIVSFELRPVGYGIMDVLSVINASEKAGAEMIIVEQDKTSLNKNSLECAKLSIDYIKNIY